MSAIIQVYQVSSGSERQLAQETFLNRFLGTTLPAGVQRNHVDEIDQKEHLKGANHTQPNVYQQPENDEDYQRGGNKKPENDSTANKTKK